MIIAQDSVCHFAGTKDLSKDLKDTKNVKLVKEPAHRSLSIGGRGGYSQQNFAYFPYSKAA